MKGKRKTQTGITLIALIITIIILLILAMVSISLVINQGILDKAKYGVDKYKEEETAEQEKLAQVEEEMKKYGGNTPTEVVEPEVGSYIKYNVPYTDMYSGNDYTETTGWRYLGKDINGNQLIVSTGIPAILYYHYDKKTGNTENGWWATQTEISTISDETYQTDKGYNYNENDGEPGKYAAYGLRYKFTKIPFEYQESGTSVPSGKENTGIYRKVGSYNSGPLGEDAFKESGKKVVDVHNLTLAEMNRACTLAGTERNDSDTSAGFKELEGTAKGLFDMQDLDGYTANYWYWLASPDVSSRGNVYRVGFAISDVNWYNTSNDGVRTVVSLPSNIQLEVVE